MKAALASALMVGLGGFLGSLLRYGVVALMHRQLTGDPFPYATFVVNLVGCFLVGLIAGLYESRPLLGAEWRLFLIVGVLGGFTTFSTFGWETLALLRGEEYLRAATNVGIHIAIAIPAVWIGYTVVSAR